MKVCLRSRKFNKNVSICLKICIDQQQKFDHDYNMCRDKVDMILLEQHVVAVEIDRVSNEPQGRGGEEDAL